jgi:lipoprotein-anchoring transpeptidase ErfK/SrfK
VVDVRANLMGLDLGGGVFGAATITNRLVIARTQITRADMNTRRLTVVRDGQTIMDVPASFGTDDDPDLLTRGGTHVVMAKEPVKYMSNPRYNYFDIYVRWAVRIDNNGEFTHHNPATANAVGQQNVTHGCINMSDDNARAFYDASYLGDPVEVIGSPVPLSAQDGDIYDWTIPWEQWKAMSAPV